MAVGRAGASRACRVIDDASFVGLGRAFARDRHRVASVGLGPLEIQAGSRLEQQIGPMGRLDAHVRFGQCNLDPTVANVSMPGRKLICE